MQNINNDNNTDNNNNNISSNKSNYFLEDYSSLPPTYYEDRRCSMCQKIGFVIETEIYYNQGRNMRMAYLCCSDFLHNNNSKSTDDNYLCCYDNYMQDLGLDGHIIVAGCNGWYAQAYHTIRSIYISCLRREKIRIENQQQEQEQPEQQQQKKEANQSFSYLSTLTNKLRQMRNAKRSYSKSDTNSSGSSNRRRITTAEDNNNMTEEVVEGGGMPLENAVIEAYRLSSVVRSYLNAVEKQNKSKNSLLTEGDITSLRNPRLWPIVWRMLYNEPLLETVDKDNLVFRWKRPTVDQFCL
jgi:hypothetical protein